MAPAVLIAAGTGGLPVVLLLLCVIVVPIAAVAFARSGKGLEELGKGRFSVDFDEGSEASRDEEIRQLVEAKAYRQASRGEEPVQVESEVERLLNGPAEPGGPDPGGPAEDAPVEPGVREEIRQVVVASNERRVRRGEEPLDVESEVERLLAEFG